jgi:hypothetical protein
VSSNPNRSVDILDFAKARLGGGYAFGATPESVAGGLERLAADVRDENLMPIKITFEQVLTPDDFGITKWLLLFEAAPRRLADPGKTG